MSENEKSLERTRAMENFSEAADNLLISLQLALIIDVFSIIGGMASGHEPIAIGEAIIFDALIVGSGIKNYRNKKSVVKHLED